MPHRPGNGDGDAPIPAWLFKLLKPYVTRADLDGYVTREELEQLKRHVDAIDRWLRPHGDGQDDYFDSRSPSRRRR